jgi:hypothetical protein
MFTKEIRLFTDSQRQYYYSRESVARSGRRQGAVLRPFALPPACHPPLAEKKLRQKATAILPGRAIWLIV